MVKESQHLLENPAPSEEDKDFITSLTAGERWAWGHQRLSGVLPAQGKKTGLVRSIISHLMKEPLVMSGFQEITARAVGE
jgi:hypothetical protein